MKVTASLAAFALLALVACRRPDQGADARVEVELEGGWVREIRSGVTGVEGFDLRADGSLALLGIFSLNGVAWNFARGELVISTNTDRQASTTPVRLRVESFENGLLVLGPPESDYLAGTWRRSDVRRVTGVVTYLEPVALPPDARVEVRLACGADLLARSLITPRTPVPIAFELSYLPLADASTCALALTANITTPAGPLFATSEPSEVASVAADGDTGDAVELVVHPSHP